MFRFEEFLALLWQAFQRRFKVVHLLPHFVRITVPFPNRFSLPTSRWILGVMRIPPELDRSIPSSGNPRIIP